MSRNKTVAGTLIFALIVVAGFVGYQRFLAPVPSTPTPIPQTGAVEDIISAQGILIPRHRAELAFRVGGRVAEVVVTEGQTVRQGDILVHLQDDEWRAGLMQARAALDLARANLAQLEDGARPEQITQAKASLRMTEAHLSAAIADRDRLTGGANDALIAAAQANLAATQVEQKLARDAYDRIEQNKVVGTLEEQARFRLNAANQAVQAAQKALDDALSGSSFSVRAAQANIAAAMAQRDLAQAQLDQLNNGATKSQLAAAEASVAQAEAAVQAAQAALNETSLVAPFDGTIAQIAVDAGQVIAPGFAVVSIADMDAWHVQTDDLSEVDVVKLTVGDPASMTIDAIPDETLEGVIVSITPRAETKRGDVTYTVKIDVTGDDPRLYWGMTVQVEIRPGD